MYIETMMEMLSAIKNVYQKRKKKLTHNVDKGSSVTTQKTHTHTHTHTRARAPARARARTHARTHAHTLSYRLIGVMDNVA